MKVLVFEDEHLAFCSISKQLQQIIPHIQISSPVVDIAGVYKAMEKQHEFDIILADIHLQDGLCFEALQNIDITTPIIFTTTNNKYALEAFRNNGISYLQKPIDLGELRKAVYKAIQLNCGAKNLKFIIDFIKDNCLYQNYRKRFLVPDYDGEHIIEVQDIDYIAWNGKHVVVHLAEKVTKRMDGYTLDNLEKELPPNLFFRVNRQYIVNIHSIKHISNSLHQTKILYLKSDSNVKIHISKEKALKLKEWIDK